MSSIPSRWRAPVTGAVAGLVVVAAVLGPSALASSGHSASGQASGARTASAAGVARKARAADASCTTSAARAKVPSGDPGPDPGPGPFLAAVAQLKQAGTITDAQARVIDADIRAGSIDPQQLVASGTLTSAQMQVVNARLIAVKRGLAAANGAGGAPGPTQPKPPQG